MTASTHISDRVSALLLADGSGYLAEDSAPIAAMRASYRERGWPWFGEEGEAP